MKNNNITITIYWPPTEEYINDEQYGYLAEAGIDHILGAGEETLHTPENQEKMIRLCEKHGMTMTVHDGSFGPSLIGKNADEIKAAVRKYVSFPSVDGFYLQDEPLNPNVYIKAAKAIKEEAPDKTLHLNFFPYVAYPDKKTYEKQMRDWCALCHANGFDVDFLTYDMYPFGFEKGHMNREAYYENLDICRRVGLDHGVKTGIYLQSVSLIGGYPAPDAYRLEYSANLALAYGFKWLSYFTYFTPVNRPNESFADGIMTHDGKKTPLYDTVKRLNERIHMLGEHIGDCDCLWVYGNGTSWGRASIPETLFVQPCDKLSYTLSFLSGKRGSYLMVVNDNFLSKCKLKLKFDKRIKDLSYLSSNGGFKPLKLHRQTAEIRLAPGGCCLISLPEGEYDVPEAIEENENKARSALIYATSSLGSNGYYISSLNDGVRAARDGDGGWRSTSDECCDIIIDLKTVKKFDRIDLYRSNALFFPRNFAVSVSTDGKSYDIIGSCGGYEIGSRSVCTVQFDEAEARYIKLSIVKQVSSLRQIEVYHDPDGAIKAQSSYELYGEKGVTEYSKGENIALGKPVYASSQTSKDYLQWGWNVSYLTDGTAENGFSSEPKRNFKPNSEEFAIIDLGDKFKIDRVDITAKGLYPRDYSVLVSTDGGAWREFVAIEGMKPVPEGMTVEHTSKSVLTARYVMIKGTYLRGNDTDGCMLQLGEVEVYGSPVCDTTELKKALSIYESHGGDISSSIYTEPLTLEERGELTQSGAERYTRLLLDAVDPDGTLSLDGEAAELKRGKHVSKKAVGIAAAGAAALAAAAIGAIIYKKKKK